MSQQQTKPESSLTFEEYVWTLALLDVAKDCARRVSFAFSRRLGADALDEGNGSVGQELRDLVKSIDRVSDRIVNLKTSNV